jgi:hypothetical protein
MANPPSDYKDPYWTNLSKMMEKKHGLPTGLLVNIVQRGEKTNNDRESPVGAKTVYQIMPNTRSLFLKKYGVDAFESPQAAAEVAALHLKESLQRNKGNVGIAVREYHGGPNRSGWGKVNDAYVGRVLGGSDKKSWSDIEKQVGKSSAPQRRDSKLEIDALLKAYDKSKAKTTKAQQPKINKLSENDLLKAFDAKKATEPKTSSLPDFDAQGVIREDQPIEPTRPKPELSLGQKIVGAGEAVLSAGTGAVGGILGTAGGALLGAGREIAAGEFGSPEAAQRIAQTASQGAQTLTYEPQTQGGQRIMQGVGQIAEDVGLNTLPPTLGGGLGTTAATLGRASIPTATVAARDVAQAAKPAISQIVDTAKAGGQRAVDMVTGGSDISRPSASMGAAQVDDATRRVTMANELPVPLGQLHTEGTATRDPYQLKFEAETAKSEVGSPLINRVEERHAGVIQNMDAFNEATGAQLNDKYQVGGAISSALQKEYANDKTKTRAAYAAADKSDESKVIVDLSRPVSNVIEDKDINLMEYLNTTVEGATETIIPTARKLAVHHGIADEVDGLLVPKPATIKQLENFRKDITAKTDSKEGADMRQAAIIKGLVDGHTEPFEGTLYKKARAARTEQAKRWERNSILDRIMGTKRNTEDRKVALEDVVDTIVKRGSKDDVDLVRKTLLSSGDDGKQALSELQGALLRDIQDQATKGVAPDANGQPMVSPAALNKAISSVDDKLDSILGKQAADKLRLLNDVSKDLLTLPASAAVNHSNTASAIAAMIDATLMMGTGVPAPIASAMKVATSHLRNRKLKQRVEKALNLDKSLKGKF